MIKYILPCLLMTSACAEFVRPPSNTNSMSSDSSSLEASVNSSPMTQIQPRDTTRTVNSTVVINLAPQTPPAAKKCTTPWGQTIADGTSVIAYLDSKSSNCSAMTQNRACNNGTLSGIYTYGSCSTIQSPPVIVTPPAPSYNTLGFQFQLTSVVCNSTNSDYGFGGNNGQKIQVKNDIIATYKANAGSVGRCPDSDGYKYWVDSATNIKNVQIGQEWNYYLTKIKPFLIAGLKGEVATTTQSMMNGWCNNQAKSYGSPYTGYYTAYSGNQCILK